MNDISLEDSVGTDLETDGRREALKKLAVFGAYTAPVMVTLLTSKKVLAASAPPPPPP